MLHVIAFDCFGTVFNMAAVPGEEIRAYGRHVRADDFTPYTFPASWWNLPLHPDAAEGVGMLQAGGYRCVTLSNGTAELLQRVSEQGGIHWDQIIDLVKHRVYKPNPGAYLTVEQETGCKPADCMLVTANPTFGDLEGAAAIGMSSCVIRQPGGVSDIIELARRLVN